MTVGGCVTTEDDTSDAEAVIEDLGTGFGGGEVATETRSRGRAPLVGKVLLMLLVT